MSTDKLQSGDPLSDALCNVDNSMTQAMKLNTVRTTSSPLTLLSPANPEKINEIQENLITYFRLFADLPGITLVEEDVIWIASNGLPGNLVLRAQIVSDPIEQRIDEIIRQIGQYADQFDWFVFPSCQPPGFGEQLAARGLAGGPDGAWMLVGQVGGPGGTWMLADLTAFPSAPEVPDNFHVEFVGDHKQLVQWRWASAAGFRHDIQQLEGEPFYEAYARHGFGPDACSLHYIGYLDEQPATSGTLLLAGGIAGLFDISTPPAFRRQGLGSAVTRAMLQDAQRRGYQQAYVWSSPLGKDVYARVGFAAVDIGMREYQWQKR